MTDTPGTTPPTPRIVDGPAMSIAGLNERYSFENLANLPAQWQRFGGYFGHVPGQVGAVAYGVCYNTSDSGFDYISGVEVADFGALPPEFATLRVADQRYAVFTHTGHISAVRGTFMSIFSDWLPKLGYQPANAPVFERYDERFDPQTDTGSFEIWVPIKT